MLRIERSIEINRKPEEVFDLLTNLDRLPDWATIVIETRDVSNKPLHIGTTFQQTIRVASQNLDTEWRVAELEWPRHVAYEATAPGGGHLALKQTVVPTDGGSRVQLELDYELPGGFLGDLVDRMYLERRNEWEAEHSLHNLKDLLEGSATQ